MSRSETARVDREDRMLVRRALLGDVQALSKMYLRCRATLTRILHWFPYSTGTGRGDILEELTFQTIRSLPLYSGTGNFRAWVMKVALAVAEDIKGRPSLSPAAPMAPSDLQLELERALADLPENYRKVIIAYTRAYADPDAAPGVLSEWETQPSVQQHRARIFCSLPEVLRKRERVISALREQQERPSREREHLQRVNAVIEKYKSLEHAPSCSELREDAGQLGISPQALRSRICRRRKQTAQG